MKKPCILHVDENHPLLIEGLKDMGYENVIEYTTPLEKLIPNLKNLIKEFQKLIT